MKYTNIFSEQIERLKEALNTAESIVIGAGAGLSASAGFSYDGERFKKFFSDFGEKYGFSDMYSGGFYPYKAPEEYWAYWSRYIFANRYTNPPKPVYDKLLTIMRDKDYFVLTTNVDHCFQKAGFDKKRLFYTQGDYGLFQCSVPCHSDTYDNEKIIRQMLIEQHNMKVPAELLPKCPKCGCPLAMNLRSDDKFVEDEGWLNAAKRYTDFIRTRKNHRILFLELGVGYNTPVIIKYPFCQMTMNNSKAVYACINLKDSACPIEIENQSICIDGDIGEVIERLTKK